MKSTQNSSLSELATKTLSQKNVLYLGQQTLAVGYDAVPHRLSGYIKVVLGTATRKHEYRNKRENKVDNKQKGVESSISHKAN